jgi:serine/threonine-protein kinase
MLDRGIAVKTLTVGPDDTPEVRVRFLREAQAAGVLTHPNIVTVYDVGEEAAQPYIAMEYVEGEDLDQLLQHRDPPPLEWRLDVLRQLCDGLAHAHRSGIVHRDVKPGNIRVTSAGRIKIMDFGLARLPASTMTKSGDVLGTVHYMAPEQIEGKDVDLRADVFSVGAVAYELLAGRKPFAADTLAGVMSQIVHGAPDASALPQTPYSPRLERVVLKALERDRNARYQSLDEMQTALATLVREAARRGV